jgi:type I restriction enzyme S subunit
MIRRETTRISGIQNGYKMTKVGLIPEEWSEGPVSSIAYVNPRTDISHLEEDSQIFFLSMGNVGEDGRICTMEIKPYAEVRNGYTVFADGDILIAKITPCMENGKGALVGNLKNGVGFGSTEFHVLRPIDPSDAEFIYQLSRSSSFRREAIRYFTGSAGQQRVSKDLFTHHLCPIPKPGERHRIAAVLSTVDAAIAATDEVIAKTEELKRGLMQDLLTKGIDEEGRVRSEETDIFCEKTINSTTFKFPEPWEFKTMGDVITLKRGYDLPSDERLAGNVPVISSSGISGYHQEAKVCGPGVVTGRYGTLGEVFFIERDFWPLNTTLYVCNFKGNDPKFISYFLRLHLAAYQSDALSIPGINRNFVHKLLCAVPPLPEQHRIAAILSAVDREHRDRLQTLKKGLMQDLLTGRVRVPPNGAGGTACPGPERVTACDLPPGHTP